MDEGIVITGANGQVGKALAKLYPNATFVDSAELDITNIDALNKFDWSNKRVLINAAAYTNVDGAETNEGRIASWMVNSVAVKNLTKICAENDIILLHFSTDYVFDGTKTEHSEDEPFSPLSSYGSSKAAGDLCVQQLKKHYLLRTAWVVGDGKNFVHTMCQLAEKGINPTVVSDQFGRLTFASEIARAVKHLLDTNSPYGTYNVTNSGDVASWADVAREVFKLSGKDITVTDTTTEEYFSTKENVAKRPMNGTLNLSKIQSTGFMIKDWREDLKNYLKRGEII